MTVESTVRPLPEATAGSQLVRRWEPPDTRAEVVIVHGIAEHSGRYTRVGDALAAAGFAVVAFDLIGFGATGGRRAYIDDWARYYDQVQGHVETARDAGRPVVLLGNSMGGLIALGYGLSARPRPDLLVLSAPAVRGGSRAQHALARLLAPVAGTVAVPNMLKGDQLSRDPAVAEAYFSDPLVHTSSTVRFAAEFFAAMDRIREACPQLAVRTLVLHGGLDTIVPPTATVVLASSPMVERRLYPALRHEVFNEPEGPEVIAEVVAWLEKELDAAG